MAVFYPSSNDELILVDERPIFNLDLVAKIVICVIQNIFIDVRLHKAIRFDSLFAATQDFISEYLACVSVGFERIKAENGLFSFNFSSKSFLVTVVWQATIIDIWA